VIGDLAHADGLSAPEHGRRTGRHHVRVHERVEAAMVHQLGKNAAAFGGGWIDFGAGLKGLQGAEAGGKGGQERWSRRGME
jgi:hypothetical protein